jgi:hypothetical protein
LSLSNEECLACRASIDREPNDLGCRSDRGDVLNLDLDLNRARIH